MRMNQTTKTIIVLGNPQRPIAVGTRDEIEDAVDLKSLARRGVQITETSESESQHRSDE